MLAVKRSRACVPSQDRGFGPPLGGVYDHRLAKGSSSSSGDRHAGQQSPGPRVRSHERMSKTFDQASHDARSTAPTASIGPDT